MHRFIIVLCVPLVLAGLATPPEPLTSSSWERQVAKEIDDIVKSHTTQPIVDEEAVIQEAWSIASDISPTADKPKAPNVADAVSSLRSLMDHAELENVNSVANQDALSASYSSKRALLQSEIAGPQQAITARAEQRLLCDHELKALQQLEATIGSAVQRGQKIAEMRKQQASHYTDMTATIKKLTLKNTATLQQVQGLIQEELEAQSHINGAMQFDPVSLRQQQPEDMLTHAEELTNNLLQLLTSKLAHQDAALQQIKTAFACADCAAADAQLQDAAAKVKSDYTSTQQKCSAMIEAHRVQDEADRERVLALKKDLDNINEAERVHQAAEDALKKERSNTKAVAEKIVGFYQSLSS